MNLFIVRNKNGNSITSSYSLRIPLQKDRNLIGNDGNDAWHDNCHHDDGSRCEKDDKWIETNDSSNQMHVVFGGMEGV